MTTDVPATHDLTTLTASLKKRIETSSQPAGEQSGTDAAPIPHELQQELLEGLEMLMLEAEKMESMPQPQQPRAARGEAELSDRLASLLDQSMARWQAQLTCSFEQTATRELGDQLALASRLAGDLERQKALLDAQRQALEVELAQTLELKARLARQRKTLAQQFRAERAELTELAGARDSAARLEFEAQQQEHEKFVTQIESLQQELAATQQLLRSAEQARSSQADAIGKAAELESELALLHEQLQTTREQLQTAEEALADVELQNFETQIESLQQELAASRQMLSSAEQAQSSQADATDKVAELESELALLQEQLQAAREQLHTAEETLAEARLQPAVEAVDEAQLEALEQRLDDQQMELLDLRSQNSDLAAQVAKYQVTASGNASHSSSNQESLSWEERKKLIMQQLDSDEAEGEEQAMKSLEIEDILSKTQNEIDRRDREIAQLQALLEQQSNAHEGVAIGAAAIAQMLDSDELINQERQKLKDIQREWEDKLRQAEIDLSMERAKLSRERTQLESQLEQARTSPVEPTAEIEGQTKAQARTRKWLEHLGLKEGRHHE